MSIRVQFKLLGRTGLKIQYFKTQICSVGELSGRGPYRSSAHDLVQDGCSSDRQLCASQQQVETVSATLFTPARDVGSTSSSPEHYCMTVPIFKERWAISYILD